MAFRAFLTSALVAGLFIISGSAFAQSPECNRFRAELDNLNRTGGASQAVLRQRQELERMRGYYTSIGCNRRGFFFSSPPPEECPAIAQRIRGMEASLGRLEPSRAEVDARRQQLIAAINRSCSGGGDNRNFFDRLFGNDPGQQQMQDPNAPIAEDPSTPRLGGSRVVCVRLCDGYNFPLSNSGRGSADEMCQALCPAADTRAFSMPASDDGLKFAASVSGHTPYTSLPNAFKFLQVRDPSCNCKADNQKWSEVLQGAEQLLDRHDTIVSAERAAEMSRAPAMRKQAAIAKKAEQAETAESQAAAKEGESAPTAGRESAGIGPQSIESGRVVGVNEGVKIEGKASDGSKRTIRVITPSSLPANLTDEGESN
ncbi:DUF2865 domain-containing protein [Microvirga sp. W0021]|uniref:DUF2865 domain-containing protein n=1 Tax=Hohaiivirga grylli TaxID=3133970 RepID=A0ABV0BIF8_9HYPH